MGSKEGIPSLIISLLLLVLLVKPVTAGFNFKELVVSAGSTVTNITTTYTVLYDQSTTNNFQTTNWTTALASTSTVTLSFPVQYTITNAITCTYSINNTGTYTANPCTVSTNVVTLSNLFSNTVLKTLSVMVTNVLNPYPAGITSNFSGTIGTNIAVPNGVYSVVTITAGASLCSFTFSPNYVYYNNSKMIFTLTTKNQFPDTGTIIVKFPSNRLWSQDLDTTRYMPITTGTMICTSSSSVTLSRPRMLTRRSSAAVHLLQPQ